MMLVKQSTLFDYGFTKKSHHWNNLSLFLVKILWLGYQRFINVIQLQVETSRSSYQRCSMKKGVLREISSNSQEDTCSRVSFSIKLQDLGSFPLNFTKFPSRTFLQNTSGRWLLLDKVCQYTSHGFIRFRIRLTKVWCNFESWQISFWRSSKKNVTYHMTWSQLHDLVSTITTKISIVLLKN